MHGARTELYVPKKKKVYINYKAQYLHKGHAGKKILAVDLQYQSTMDYSTLLIHTFCTNERYHC